MLQLRIQRLAHAQDLCLPSYGTALSAGLDLPAAIDAEQVLQPGQRAVIPTGFALAVPEGYEAQIRPRSGLAAKHGVSVLNAPGTIDADYRGELKVILINHGQEPFTLQRGDRIAQLVIAPVIQARLIEGDVDEQETERGAGGFGSTGVRRAG
ncbi:MAG: dUTP diphosphatase [Holosporales bacterium]